MEQPLTKEFEVKWADLDPNRHMRHSAYNDYAAHMRVKILEEAGLTMAKMESLKMGPILFREETKFYREVGMEGSITITAALSKSRSDGSRWSFVHEMYRQDGIKAATIEVDGAWLDIEKRKLAIPPKEIADLFLSMPKTENFTLEPSK
ncbi:thioesterase family protein [Fulvivirga lutimaris]|uniref:thioesterase family protein n=1 Tax=Fulvivirga lutimaris TaxID=1819566 RepID=UPI0012BD1522|nr:thioesterase family protein [Fulvivirga lutimaris]MTI38490.1 thioesterase [Fulvivirga lutimaris]